MPIADDGNFLGRCLWRRFCSSESRLPLNCPILGTTLRSVYSWCVLGAAWFWDIGQELNKHFLSGLILKSRQGSGNKLACPVSLSVTDDRATRSVLVRPRVLERGPYTDWVLNPLPKAITAFGILCVVVGLALGFIASDTSSDFAFLMRYAYAFLIPLLTGVLLSFVGTVAWARHLDRRRKLKLAAWIFIMSIVPFPPIPNNVHGPGMIVIVFVVLPAWILSVVLAVMAAVGADDAAN